MGIYAYVHYGPDGEGEEHIKRFGWMRLGSESGPIIGIGGAFRIPHRIPNHWLFWRLPFPAFVRRFLRQWSRS